MRASKALQNKMILLIHSIIGTKAIMPFKGINICFWNLTLMLSDEISKPGSSNTTKANHDGPKLQTALLLNRKLWGSSLNRHNTASGTSSTTGSQSQAPAKGFENKRLVTYLEAALFLVHKRSHRNGGHHNFGVARNCSWKKISSKNYRSSNERLYIAL